MSYHFGDHVHGDKVGGDKHSYHGPVVHGDGQLAWGNQNVTQTSKRTEAVAPGFEELADAMRQLLARIDRLGLAPEDLQDVRAAGNDVLEEIAKPVPDRSVVRRSLAALRSFLTPVVMGVSAGGADGVKEWVKSMVEQFGSMMPSP